jgi:hypothetical protein
MSRVRMGVAAVAVTLVLVSCGDDDDFDQPESVNVGEQQRQACVDSGKIAVVEDDMVIGCVTVEQYGQILELTPSPVGTSP